MDVTSLFQNRVGIDALTSPDLAGAFAELASALVEAGASDAANAEGIAAALLEREESGTTAVGHGFAIPHVITDAVDRVWVAAVRHSLGLDMGAGDGEDTTIMICIVAPESEREAYLSLLRAVAGTLRDGQWRRFVRGAPDASVIFETLIEATAV